ncbi:glutamate receptor ionotropic, delta-1 [Colias croceus]|uniref:glutamate receptor ionotropic, delta-1 n=1 Tax=Colias crocea TaxID=72248 RepID=UPI001E27B5D1|nr:glutamate receptor ionotropic, delta-1 [Colias croceus]
MAGLDIIFSSVCNATFCENVYDNPLNDAKLTGKQNETLALRNLINGKHLKIGTFNNYPTSWTERAENGTYTGHGVAFEIINILQEKFNFTYEVVVPEKNFIFGNGRPEEYLIGLLNTSKIDMAAAFIPVLNNYDRYVQFSAILDEGTWMMMLKRPKESAAGSGLLAPFDEMVWYLILIAVVAYGPCVTLLTRLRNKLMPDDENYIPISPSIWFVYGAFIKQGTSLSPNANTTRVLFATWWIFVILLSAFYTANLTAFLTLSKFTLEIETLQDLYKKNYRWFATEGGAVEYAVKNTDEGLYFLTKMIANGRAKFRSITDVNEFLSYVSEGAVLVSDGTIIDHMMYFDYLEKTRQGIPEAERCTYVVAPGSFMQKRRAFAFPRNTTLNSLFQPILHMVTYSGIIKYLERKKLPDTKICPLDLQSKDRQLRNTDLLMTYYIMAVGLATAVSVFVGEVTLKRYGIAKYKGKHLKIVRKQLKPTQNFNFDDTRPPPYESLFGKSKKGTDSTKKIINGREYWVINKENGETRLIPVRTPSALLYR